MNSVSDQKNVFADVLRARRAGRLAHAYLIAGRADGAAGELAHKILEMLYCVSGGDEPCGECLGCGMARRHTHPDMMWIEPQQKSRLIKIDTVREAQAHVSYTSPDGKYKAVVFAKAERMQEPAANAMLKTIEEPPGESLLLLVTDTPESLLPTVVSRCQKLDATEPDAGQDKALLDAVAGAMKLAAGGGALSAFAGAHSLMGMLEEIKTAIEKEEKANDPDIPDLDSAAREDLKKIREARIEYRFRTVAFSVLKRIQDWHGDALSHICGASELSVFSAHARLIAETANGLTFARAANNIRLVENMKDELNRNMSMAHIFENAFAQFGFGSARDAGNRA